MKISTDKQAKSKKKHDLQKPLRLTTQIVFFALFPSAYSAAFAGVKYIFQQIGAHQMVQLTPFVAIMIALCGYTVVFGRFFCGYACAFGSLGDWIFALHKMISRRAKRKPLRIPQKTMDVLAFGKYLVLAGIVILCVMQVFDKTAGMSPWDAFSQLHALQFDKLGDYWIGCLLLGLMLVGMFFSERFFCRVICPMGAVFSILPVLLVFSLHRNRTACIKGCSACNRICPANIELADAKAFEVSGECFQCHKCIGICPRGNIGCRCTAGGTSCRDTRAPQSCSGVPGEMKGQRKGLRGDEIPFTLIRIAILVALFIWLGV